MAKRSLEIKLSNRRDLHKVANVLAAARIQIAEARDNFVQVRNTTPTEIKRVTKGFKLASIQDGFRR